MSKQNQAVWLKAKQDKVMVVDEAPYPSCGPDELVVRNEAVAMNPADVLIQNVGVILTKFPAILGCDVAGVVEEVGTDLKETFRPGDRVIGGSNPVPGYKYSGFQRYTVLKMPMIAKIPDNASFSNAVVLPLGLSTAASCLFEKNLLGMTLPPNKERRNETLIIWGASSSVGSCGVQLAIAAGYEVFAIASSRNHDFLRSIGAQHCFDYKNESLIEDALQALKGKAVIGACDAISTPDTLRTLSKILERSGGRKFIASIMPGSAANSESGVTIKDNLGEDMVASGVAKHIWRDFLESALVSGSVQYKPDAEIVGNGLENVQKGLNLLAKGVSAKKLVVTL